MTLRWTQEAASDLECIANYLFDHAPDRAGIWSTGSMLLQPTS